jgi:hypothetical protein
MISIRLALVSAVAAVLPMAAQTLDFETYKTKVESVFLKKRPPHARCVSCHSASNSAFRLEPLPKGTTAYTEEQSRKNFEFVKNLVKPGDPESSRLLKHPLAPEAGGDTFHNGGRQFTSKDDPDWKAIAAWVSSAK